MALLDPIETAAPNAVRAFAKLRERDRRFHVVRRNWIWATTVASVACVVLIALPSKSVCCARTPDASEPPAPAAQQTAPPAQAPVLKPAPVAAKPAPVTQVTPYKESGSPTAPLACEIYTDFECPACAVFYRDTYPQLDSEYVQTGKVRIVHRDFPLPQHPFAQLAARYADAAGELGQYNLVFNRLFETQAEWSANGNIEAAVKPVLAPDVMSRLQDLLANDHKPDDSIAADKVRGMADQLNQTPTLVIVTPDGERHKLGGAVPFVTLSAYLDQLLSQ